MQGFRQELVSSAVQGSRMEGSLARRGERRGPHSTSSHPGTSTLGGGAAWSGGGERARCYQGGVFGRTHSWWLMLPA